MHTISFSFYIESCLNTPEKEPMHYRDSQGIVRFWFKHVCYSIHTDDDNRIVLRPMANSPSDYINASYIDVSDDV